MGTPPFLPSALHRHKERAPLTRTIRKVTEGPRRDAASRVLFFHTDCSSRARTRPNSAYHVTTNHRPQLYVKGEFIGGFDIVREMAENAELQETLKEKGVAAA